MTARLFLRLLNVRKWLIVIMLFGTVAVAIQLATNIPETYSTTTSLVLDFGEANPFDQARMPRQLASSYIATQIDIIRSPAVAYRVLDIIKLDTLRNLAGEYLSEYNANQIQNEALRERLALAMIGTLEVVPARDSQVVSLRFSSNDPYVAVDVTNAFAEAYIRTALELNIDPARRNAEWFDGQLIVLRNRLEQKQAALTTFQKEKGIITFDERLDSEVQRYEALASDLVRMQNQTYEVRSRQLGTKHPQYRQAVEQEQAVERALDEQKQRVFAVKEEHDALDLLVQDVENAKKTYDIALQEFYKSTMESQFNQTNVAILSPATTPATPAGPNLTAVIVSATFLGLVLGIFLAVIAELFDRKVRIEEDVTGIVHAPVLASL